MPGNVEYGNLVLRKELRESSPLPGGHGDFNDSAPGSRALESASGFRNAPFVTCSGRERMPERVREKSLQSFHFFVNVSLGSGMVVFWTGLLFF